MALQICKLVNCFRIFGQLAQEGGVRRERFGGGARSSSPPAAPDHRARFILPE
jgi:hypothetical protein